MSEMHASFDMLLKAIFRCNTEVKSISYNTMFAYFMHILRRHSSPWCNVYSSNKENSQNRKQPKTNNTAIKYINKCIMKGIRKITCFTLQLLECCT